MDKVKLLEVIKESGYKREFIAKKLGLTTYGLAKKINGESEFKCSEAKNMIDVLNMPRDLAFNIFLT